MRFMAIVKADQKSEAGIMPEPAFVTKMLKFNEELARAGVLLSAEGLHPSSNGTRITFAGPKPTVTDGPFAETKELVGGFWLLSVQSREEAVQWFLRSPFTDGEQVEIRQVYDIGDFSPELRQMFEEQERLAQQVAEQARP